MRGGPLPAKSLWRRQSRVPILLGVLTLTLSAAPQARTPWVVSTLWGLLPRRAPLLGRAASLSHLSPTRSPTAHWNFTASLGQARSVVGCS